MTTFRTGTLVLAAWLAGCSNGTAGPAPAAGATERIESRLGPVEVTTVAAGLEHPWGMAFLPDGGLLVTERPGRLRRLAADGTLSEPLAGVPAVRAVGQGGLLDVQLSPQFDRDRWVYISYAEPGDGNRSGTAVARGRLDDAGLQDVEVIFRQQPKIESGHHYGSRLVFDRDGYLFVTLGDRGQRAAAQDTSNHFGTIVRLRPDGTVPADNPFSGDATALHEIWSYGHRNVQAAALNPWSGALWSAEHGPRGGDEINRPQRGANFGWPKVTHGIDYSGLPIPEAEGTALPGMQPPLFVWEVSPAVSGMAFYDHERTPAWQRSLFVGALAQRALIRLSVDGDRIREEERLLETLRQRIRDVEVGPDGALYVLTDETAGRLLRLELAAQQ